MTENLRPARMNKTRLLGRIHSSRTKWEKWLSRFEEANGEARMSEPNTPGDWSVKDVIAHITWHERQMLGALQARALIGSPWWDLPLDQRNQLIYEENLARPLAEVRQEASQVHAALLQAIEGLDEKDLHDAERFQGMPEKWKPWELLAGNTYEHYQAHTPRRKNRSHAA
ncbi:MAG TPA: ClbS/DfsB family four-helix bundle protein [Anaerolineales bacterium]|nr:ClbS/DfsB family four-helix bundle protein [Anaerolineales bacterium]